MPLAPQHLFYFDGIPGLMSATLTLGHGVGPCICTMYIPRPEGLIPIIGTLRLVSDGLTAAIFPNCKVTFARFEKMRGGEEIWQLSIADVRWSWSGGNIDGEYNVRLDDGSIREGTEKKPRDLLKLLFDAMGVRSFDADEVPNDQLPECIWETARPDQELQTLLDKLGCSVTLNSGNLVRCVRLNLGKLLPYDNLTTDLQSMFEAVDQPEAIVLVGGRILYQQDLELEAVGLDVDGSIKLINELSYTPEGGWAIFDLDTGNQIKETPTDPIKGKLARELALESVFKWYRPVVPINIWEDNVRELSRILPLSDRQLRTGLVLGKKEYLPAVLYGRYATGDSGFLDNLEVHHDVRGVAPKFVPLTGDLKKNPHEEYTKGFSIDGERGLVKLNQPAYRHEFVRGPEPPKATDPTKKLPRIDSYKRIPASLYLRTSFNARDPVTRGFEHYEKRLQITAGRVNLPPKYIPHKDVVLRRQQDGPPGAAAKDRPKLTNEAVIEKVADEYLAADFARLGKFPSGAGSYATLRPVFLDGAFRQVTWSVAETGEPTTRVSRNFEEPSNYALTYEQRRFEQRALEAIEGKDRKEPPRVRK